MRGKKVPYACAPGFHTLCFPWVALSATDVKLLILLPQLPIENYIRLRFPRLDRGLIAVSLGSWERSRPLPFTK